MDRDLRSAQNAEAVFEANLRAAVGAEAIGQQVAEVALSERTREAMRHPKRARELGHAQRRRQSNEREVRLTWIDSAIARRLCRLRRWRARRFLPWCLCSCLNGAGEHY